MKNKFEIGKVVKVKKEVNGTSLSLIGEIENITQSKSGFEYKIICNDDIFSYVKETEIIASYSMDATRKPRTTAKKSKASKVQPTDNANETNGEN